MTTVGDAGSARQALINTVHSIVDERSEGSELRADEDRDVVGHWVRVHGPALWRALRYLGVPEDDVPDACQEVFLVALRRHRDFEGRSEVSTWLYGIAWRVASSWRRRAAREREAHQQLARAPVVENGREPPSPERETERLRWQRSLLSWLDELHADQRDVFVLHAIEELPLRRVAEVLGIPEGTAFSRWRLARRRMRALARPLEQGTEEPEP